MATTLLVFDAVDAILDEAEKRANDLTPTLIAQVFNRSGCFCNYIQEKTIK